MKHHFRGFTSLTSLQPVDVWNCTEQHLLGEKKNQKKNNKEELETLKLQYKLRE